MDGAGEAQAGPSRQRRPTTPTRLADQNHTGAPTGSQRPASPETALAGGGERGHAREHEMKRELATKARQGHIDTGDTGGGRRRMDGQDTCMSPDPPGSSGDAPHPQPASAPPPPPAPAPRLDLAKFNTPALLRLLANLLQQIANANDQIRPDLDDDEDEDGGSHPHAGPAEGGGDDEREGRSKTAGSGPRSAVGSRAASRASSTSTATGTAGAGGKRAHPSPTSALFPNAPTPPSSRPHLTPSPARADTSDHPASLYAQPPDALFSASKTSLHHPASLLSFHARHVPSISIEAYLLRILKYCPTTNEVFLSLLVYFDRMSKLGTAQGLGGESVDPTGNGNRAKRGFAIDSYNVHRLVIAGVTVASKFFSGMYCIQTSPRAGASA